MATKYKRFQIHAWFSEYDKRALEFLKTCKGAASASAALRAAIRGTAIRLGFDETVAFPPLLDADDK